MGSCSGLCDSVIGWSWSRISSWNFANTSSASGSMRYVRAFQVKVRVSFAERGAAAIKRMKRFPSGSCWSSVTEYGKCTV